MHDDSRSQACDDGGRPTGSQDVVDIAIEDDRLEAANVPVPEDRSTDKTCGPGDQCPGGHSCPFRSASEMQVISRGHGILSFASHQRRVRALTGA